MLPIRELKCSLLGLFCLALPSLACGLTAEVEFDPPGDPTFITGVFVSETAGDYSECFGQLSVPGEVTVSIGNLAPATTYYFSAKRYDSATWESSPWSKEHTRTTPADGEPIMVELPMLPMGDKTISITVEIK